MSTKKQVITRGLCMAVAMMSSPLSLASSLNQIIDNSTCGAKVALQLSQWQATDDSRNLPSLSGSVFKIATATIGRWLLFRANDELMSLSKIEPESVITKTWDRQCQLTESIDNTQEFTKNIQDRFNDAQLADLLKNNDAGLVYTWSPHMLLSIDGIKELEHISRKLNISYRVLLDPNADQSFAEAMIKERGLSDKLLQRAGSLELLFRGMTIHAPTLLLYQSGEIVGPVIPGYRHPEHYEQVIKERLAI